MIWDEVCANRDLRGLPFRIETNRWGQVVLTLRDNNDSVARTAIREMLLKQMLTGRCLQETVISTEQGNKVTDAVWMSDRFIRSHKGQCSFQHAPEICVGVSSARNPMGELLEKKDLYFKAGAQEVWIWEQSGTMLFFNADGPLDHSALCPAFPKTVKI